MKLLSLIVVCLITPALCPFAHAGAADITGQWSIDGSLNGTPISFDCAFKQVEKRLAGSCKAYQFAVTASGTVEEDTVQFSYIYNFAGAPYKCTYTGKLNGASELKGSIAIAGIDGSKGEFVAKRI
jgi:hypothetical protein